MRFKTKFTVRRATKADEIAVRALQDAALRIESRHDHEIEGLLTHVGALDNAVLEDGTCFLAIADGEVVASGSWSPRGAAFNAFVRSGDPLPAGSAVIHGVYVDPAFASTNLGQQILSALEWDIGAMGYAQAHVATVYAALPFYQSAGYRPAQLLSLAFPDGGEVHGVRMAKDIPLIMAAAA